MVNFIQKIQYSVHSAALTTVDQTWNTHFFNPLYRCIRYSRLYMPCSGEGFIEGKNKTYKLKKGSLFLVAPYARVLVNCPVKMVKYWCHFNATVAELGNDVFSALPEVTELQLTDEQFAFNTGLFEQMISVTKKKNNELTPTPLEVLRVNAAMTLLADPFLHRLPQKNIFPGDIDRIVKLVHFMNENLASNITVDKLAKIVGLHPNYLSTVFVRCMGRPPIVYLSDLRLTYAMTELQRGTMRISEIAERTGMRSRSAFSQFFHQKTGVSPREWQKQHLWSI